jgi:hypothetical protein
VFTWMVPVYNILETAPGVTKSALSVGSIYLAGLGVTILSFVLIVLFINRRKIH